MGVMKCLHDLHLSKLVHWFSISIPQILYQCNSTIRSRYASYMSCDKQAFCLIKRSNYTSLGRTSLCNANNCCCLVAAIHAYSSATKVSLRQDGRGRDYKRITFYLLGELAYDGDLVASRSWKAAVSSMRHVHTQSEVNMPCPCRLSIFDPVQVAMLFG